MTSLLPLVLAFSPQIKGRLDVELAEMLGDEHMKMP